MDTKICTRCNVEKPIEEFSTNKKLKSGKASRCKSCCATINKEWRIKNLEYKSAKNKEWYLENKKHALQYAKDYANSKKEEIALRKRKWYEDRKKQGKIDVTLHRKKAAEWKTLNRGKATANQRARDLAKTKATPQWLTKEQKEAIRDFYWLAKDLEKVSGEKYHVDHIVPLKGVDVCGLHVPWNLQVLPADINITKGNTVKGDIK